MRIKIIINIFALIFWRINAIFACNVSITQTVCCCNHIELTASSTGVTPTYAWYVDQDPSNNNTQAIVVFRGAHFAYDFITSGGHTIYVKATCPDQSTSFASSWVYINDVSSVNFTTSVISSTNQTSGCQTSTIGQAILFTTTVLPANVTVNWNFGDGVTSPDQNPCHLFAPNQIFEVCMTVQVIDYDANNIPYIGCTKSVCQTICTGSCCDGCITAPTTNNHE